jgi:taurine--2-oxoglutarate transaminase
LLAGSEGLGPHLQRAGPRSATKGWSMLHTTTVDWKTKHRRYVLTPWSAGQAAHDVPVIVRGEGSRIYDADGQGYLDLSSGLVAANLGHAHPRMVAAIANQAQRICYVAPGLFSDVRAELGERLAALGPWPEGARALFTAGGAEANEDAVKLARAVTGRFKVLAAYRSFHGSTLGAATLTGEMRRWANEPGVPGVVHFFAPYPYRSPFGSLDAAGESARALAHLEEVISAENPRNIAALVLEPIVGSNGVIVYPEGYLAGVRAHCDRFGILLIFDEVMTGFGRTGAAFAGERFGVVPDLITFAKGVTSAYVPMGGALVRESLASYFDRRPFDQGHTYSGHPLAAAAGVAALEAYREEGLFERARSMETHLRTGLQRLASRHASIGEVRGIGAFFGVELVEDRASRAPLGFSRGDGAEVMGGFLRSLRRRGVYVFGRFNVVCIAPPLVVTGQELEEAFTSLDGALEELGASR